MRVSGASRPLRKTNPGVGRYLIKLNTKEISLVIIFTALYAVGVIALAPISFYIFQVRVADAILTLSIIFGWPSIIGITIGTLVANVYGGLGPLDIVGGAFANFVATLLAWKIGIQRIRGRYIYAIAAEVSIVTLIVGSYLSYLFSMPILIGLSGILMGSIISIGIIGYILLRAMFHPTIINMLQSYGFKIHIKKQNKN